jgi:hypothetical protein
VKEYLVQWEGHDEPTWEPAEVIENDAPDTVKEYRATFAEQAPRRPAKPIFTAAPQKQSRRARGLPVEVTEDSDDEDDPQVHMAMCTLRSVQTPALRAALDQRELACAVKAGVAQLEADTPQTYRAAMASRDKAKWLEAMDSEMASCETLGAWKLVPRSSLPRGTTVLKTRWVLKKKVDETGELARFKARVTPKGFMQKHGESYFDVYARTGGYPTLRAQLSLTAKLGHNLYQLDVPTAFLNADVDEAVYMELPDGYEQEGMVCMLLKSLYGLKQAPRNWYLLISGFITTDLGFTPCVSDPCLFWKRTRTGRLMLLYLFVDDMQASVHPADENEWNELKGKLVARFNTKDMGESKWILGMHITRDWRAGTITLDQELYVTKALEKYGLSECKSAITPEVVGAAHQEPNEQLDRPTDRQLYMQKTGTIAYAATGTRLDLAHTVHRLASRMLEPTERDMQAADRALRYLAGTKTVGLVFGSRNGARSADSRPQAHLEVEASAYADADWANDRGDRKSITGWVAMINGDPIGWSSKKQRVVALSTCEAELYAEAAVIQQVLWLRGLLGELGIGARAGSVVHGDNQSAIAVSKNGVKGERTKHVDVKYHFITDTLERGDVQLKWVPTTEQQADIFTKALPAQPFLQLRKLLMSE